MISIRASQKLGMDTPRRENEVARLSKMEYCFVAEIIHMVTPKHRESKTPAPASLTVVGKRSSSSSVTGRFVE